MLSSDGQRIFTLGLAEPSTPQPLTLVQNWLANVKRFTP
jgi:hypothetical protein